MHGMAAVTFLGAPTPTRTTEVDRRRNARGTWVFLHQKTTQVFGGDAELLICTVTFCFGTRTTRGHGSSSQIARSLYNSRDSAFVPLVLDQVDSGRLRDPHGHGHETRDER